MPSISTPEEYEAWIVDSRTQVPLLRLPWSQIQWQRIRNEVSTASVTVAQADGGFECCRALKVSGGLMGWENCLRIERNGAIVWDGPITGASRTGNTGDLTLKAHDRFAVVMKRLVGVYRFLNSTPNQIIRQLITDGAIGNISFDPYPITISSTATTVEAMTREFFVERLERIYDCIKEVCENSSTGYFSTVAGTVHTNEAVITNALGSHSSGKAITLSEQTTIGIPGIDADFLNMATVTYAGASGSGISGFLLRQTSIAAQNLFLNSILEQAAPSSRSGDDTDLSLIAGRAAAEHAAPQITVEQVQLAPTFGSEFLAADLSNLIPGVQFRVNYENTCAFDFPVAEYRESAGVPGLAYLLAIVGVRLDQLDVTVQRSEGGGIEEKVLASCRPVITGAV